MYATRRRWSLAGLVAVMMVAGVLLPVTASAQGLPCGSPCVTLQKCGPACINLNCNFEYTITLSNPTAAPALNVVVTDQLPKGAAYLGSNPAAQVSGNVLTWRLGTLAPNSARTLTIKVKAVCKTTLVNCATVTYSISACIKTTVQEPKLVITKCGTKAVCLGKPVAYQITVKNVGDGTATNLVLTDTLPPGLTPKGANSVLKFNIGSLAPGQQRSFCVNTTAVARGTHCNTAVVTGDCGLCARASAATKVYYPDLRICKNGPASAYIRCPFNYTLSVANIGDGPSPMTILTDFLPQGLTLISASHNGQYDATTNTITWMLGDLQPGKGASVNVRVKANCIQTYCNKARVTNCCDITRWAKLVTQVKGMVGVLLEAVDHCDALCLGENVTYTVRVTNQGTAPLHNVKIDASVSAHMVPQSAGGPAAGVIQGRKITFPAVAVVPVGGNVTYTIVAKGVQSGDARLRVSLNATELTKPVNEEESTTFYNHD